MKYLIIHMTKILMIIGNMEIKMKLINLKILNQIIIIMIGILILMLIIIKMPHIIHISIHIIMLMWKELINQEFQNILLK